MTSAAAKHDTAKRDHISRKSMYGKKKDFLGGSKQGFPQPYTLCHNDSH